MIQIFVDSGANLSAELREQYNIHLLPMALTINDQPAPEGLDGHEYYEALRSGADVRTSMVNPDDAKKAFETYVSQGDDVVYFSISAGISGSWWSAKLAGDELMEEYPGRRVCPIDSMGASLGAGIPALKASSLVRQGMELDELVEKMTVYCQNYCQYFAVDDLKYLRKGGRISGASALVGSLLQIKPILRGNEEGKIVLFDKTRGKLRAIERLARGDFMTSKRLGRQTVRLAQPPSVVSYANIGGKFEGNGPLAEHFDQLCPDSFFGKDTWEQAESAMQQRVLERALEKGGLMPKDLDYVLAGDLLNQCIGTAFGLRGFDIPFFGLYGACSTMGESLALGSLLISGGHARMTACMTSSHFCTAERQYRMPVPYGSQRTPTAQWTATASGCCILADQGDGPYITHVTCGRIVDKGITDVNNMGAAMAPAACDTLSALFRETKTGPGDYDLIVTGDLGVLGHAIVTDLLGREGVDLSRNYQDCGMLLYDLDKQDMHAGASGCGCSAAVLNGYLLGGMRQGRWQRVVFAPTGALLSPTSSFQGESIPGICHAVVFSAQKEG